MSRRLWFLVALCLAVSLAGSASLVSAHPGQAPIARSDAHPIGPLPPEAVPSADPWPPAEAPGDRPHGAPPPAAFAAGALTLVAVAASRRRALAVTLAGLLALGGLEGVAHAALHLHHVAHGDGLAIGPATADAPAADPDGATPGVRLDRVAECPAPPIDARAPGRPLRPDQGRAPPALPA